jgi:hypothetical protein
MTDCELCNDSFEETSICSLHCGNHLGKPLPPRKCKRQQEQVAKILDNLPTTISELNVSYNYEIAGDAGMKHLHLIPDSECYSFGPKPLIP